jgi:hypothetical protein
MGWSGYHPCIALSSTMRPSSIVIRLPQPAAMASSWVTMTIGTARLRFRDWKMARISAAVSLSRLPVGSSASSRRGVPISARAIATRCFWPPDGCSGPWGGAAREAELLQSSESLVPPAGFRYATV